MAEYQCERCGYVPLKLETTARGFDVARFRDAYGSQCSIQKSSCATEDLIWLGVDVDFEGRETCTRMHLTQAMAAALMFVLQRFVETGELRPAVARGDEQ